MSWVAGAVLAVFGGAAPIAVAADAPALLVVAARGADATDRAAARADAEVNFVQRVAPRVDLVAVDSGQSVSAAITQLRADPAVASVELNRQITMASNDPLFGYQWALENTGEFLWNDDAVPDADIDAPEAWTRSTGSGVQVAVVDTGVQADHPDLEDAIVPGWDFYGFDDDPDDEHGHGTHVAGIIAARGGNGLGISGVAPDSSVMPLRVLNGSGTGLTSAEVAAFTYATNAGVKIVNASFGSGTYSPTEDLVIRTHPATLFVVAAGNDGADLRLHPSYPCSLNYDNVLCVGASTAADTAARSSNYGPDSVDVFAPGEDVASTWLGNGYVLESGTSMAAPHVAGTAALLASLYPSLDAGGLRRAILDGVDRPAALQGLSSSGGRLNANGALTAAARQLQQRPPLPPPANPAPPVSPPVTETTINAKDVTPPVTDTPPAVPSLLAASIAGTPRIRGGSAALVLRLSRSAKVGVELQRRRCTGSRCQWRTQLRMAYNGQAGTGRLTLRGKTPATGRWRAVATASAASRRSVEFRVRR